MLTALAVLVLALLLLSAAQALRLQVAGPATAAACGCGAMLALAALAAGAQGVLTLPVGWPGGARLALDGLSALALPLVLVPAAAWAAYGPAPPRLALEAAATLLAVLAADVFTLLLALGLLAWLGAARKQGLASAGLILLALGLTLLAAQGPDLSFAAMRAAPNDGVAAAAALGLALAGLGLLAGVAGSLPGVSAMPGLGLYLAVRLVFDLAGRTGPVWWGMPLLALGAAVAVWGGLRAKGATDLDAVVRGAALLRAGLGLAALGAGLAARGADLPALAALALGAALMLGMAQAVAGTLLGMCVDAVERQAGGALAGLGGLSRRMPGTVLALLVTAAALAGVPLSAGFAGVWLLAQALLVAPRIGGLLVQAGMAAALAGVAVAASLGAAAAVRLVGLSAMGRPRTPGAACAEDPPARARRVMAALAGLALLLGAWPPLGVALVQPALHGLLDAGIEAGWVLLAPGQDQAGYAAAPLLLLLAVSGAAAWAWSRRGTAARRVPRWTGGEPPPPSGPSDMPLGTPARWPMRLPVLDWEGLRNRIAGWDASGPALLALAGLLGWAAWRAPR